MFEIQKSESVTQKPGDKTSRISWPWKDMGVGDMVKISDQTIAPKAQVRCHIHGRQHGWKFSTQTIDGVLHIWRTA
jgi:hypothetical protein